MAIDRDPRDGIGLAISGHVQSFLMRDFESANATLDRAIAVAPNCALAWTMSGVTPGYLGDGPTAVERAERGLRLSPLDGHVFWFEGQLAQAHYVNGDYAAAVAWARRAQAQNPSAMFNLRILAASLVAQGRDAAAQRVVETIVANNPSFSLSSYEPSCPFTGQARVEWFGRLREAGLPDS
jgi:tetratricopeptide (TPR) repeat protein